MKAQLQGDGVYLFNSSGANVAAFNTNISQKGHLWVSDYVQADAGYWVGFSQGITGTRTVKDGSGNNKTVTIVGGIITGWEL